MTLYLPPDKRPTGDILGYSTSLHTNFIPLVSVPYGQRIDKSYILFPYVNIAEHSRTLMTVATFMNHLMQCNVGSSQRVVKLVSTSIKGNLFSMWDSSVKQHLYNLCISFDNIGSLKKGTSIDLSKCTLIVNAKMREYAKNTSSPEYKSLFRAINSKVIPMFEEQNTDIIITKNLEKYTFNATPVRPKFSTVDEMLGYNKTISHYLAKEISLLTNL